MPAPIKPYVKKIIETMLLTKDLAQTNKIFNETYEIFKNLKIEDISFVMGIKGYEKLLVLLKKRHQIQKSSRLP